MNSREVSLVGVCCKDCFKKEDRKGKIIYKKMLRNSVKKDLQRLLKDD